MLSLYAFDGPETQEHLDALEEMREFEQISQECGQEFSPFMPDDEDDDD